MDQITGFAAIMARYFVRKESRKPFLGKPYLTYLVYLAMAAQFFIMGGVLASKYHRNKVDFALAFLGLSGNEGATANYFRKIAREILPQAKNVHTVIDYVASRECQRLNCGDDVEQFPLQQTMQKIDLETAQMMCWGYAVEGAALGIVFNQEFRRLFEGSQRKVDEKSWQFARDCGLDIPKTQEVIGYEETEQGLSEEFLEYCKQVAPRLYTSLSESGG